MKPIDTLYKSNFFRSRLEARWAVFFDALGVSYDYEPQGFKHEGEYYLPDFYLPGCYLRHKKGLYLEIKPQSFSQQDYYPSRWFTDNLVLFIGMPEKNIWGRDLGCLYEGGYELARRNEPFIWDLGMALWKCEKCAAIKVDFEATGNNRCPECDGRCDKEILKRAAEASAKARFEHHNHAHRICH